MRRMRVLVHPIHDDRYRLIKVNTFWSERFESRRLLLHQLKVRQRLTVASSCANCTPSVSSQPASNLVREKIEEIGEQVSQSEFTSGGGKSFRILKGSKFSFREAADGLPLSIHFSLFGLTVSTVVNERMRREKKQLVDAQQRGMARSRGLSGIIIIVCCCSAQLV